MRKSILKRGIVGLIVTMMGYPCYQALYGQSPLRRRRAACRRVTDAEIVRDRLCVF